MVLFVVIVIKGVVQGLGQVPDVVGAVGQVVLGIAAPLFGFNIVPDRRDNGPVEMP